MARIAIKSWIGFGFHEGLSFNPNQLMIDLVFCLSSFFSAISQVMTSQFKVLVEAVEAAVPAVVEAAKRGEAVEAAVVLAAVPAVVEAA